MLISLQRAVVRSMIQLVLSNRPSIYGNADLTDFAGNGGSRINQKVRSYLSKLAALIPNGEKMVDEEIAKLGKGGKGKSGSATTTPTKSGAKKRKVKADEDEEEAEEEDKDEDELDENPADQL